ncbi:MAG: hypothetical protein COV72_04725 [Candidatus Omnitrophica bacterium CG11_big_fil_rev_8_21_14_0_20_42_13]|uniref:Uncharacterized protein n=1 Tax=Candidatus Ghiorseimicrobium undicola TaxID=1974746 RepID=A0A2H0LXL0_9BACT|nr:MAG: hypothetical protein COV72_04725 [Candidatus Omnitrophica bacterium CG11_big_fil_rev_8_21_14_0_20_42_13]
MDIQDKWEKALAGTKIIRPRVQELLTFATTRLPYVFLSPSSVNEGDTLVRQAEVLVERPALLLPENLPQFDGFEFDSDSGPGEETLINFLFVRGVSMPSLKYNNKTHRLDIYEGCVEKAVDFYLDKLRREEDVHTGLICGLDDYWQFSVLIFIASQIARSAEGDIKRILDKIKNKRRFQ